MVCILTASGYDNARLRTLMLGPPNGLFDLSIRTGKNLEDGSAKVKDLLGFKENMAMRSQLS